MKSEKYSKMPDNVHKFHLQAYRADPAARENADIMAALDAAGKDPELGRFLATEQAFDRSFAEKLTQIPVPQGLAFQILRKAAEQQSTSSAPTRANWRYWIHPVLMAAVASVVIFLALIFTFWKRPAVYTGEMVAVPQQQPAQQTAAPAGRFATQFATLPSASTMPPPLFELAVKIQSAPSIASRSGITARDYEQLVAYVREHGAPAPGSVPPSLRREMGVACNVYSVDGVPVGRICFKSGNSLYHLYTIDRRQFPQVPEIQHPMIQKVDQKYNGAAWTNAEQIFLLTTEDNEDNLRALLDI